MAITAFHRFSENSRFVRFASLKERIIAQLIDGIILGIICGIWLAVCSNGRLYSVWVSPMIPVYLLQVTPDSVSRVADWWWGGYYMTFRFPLISDLHLAYPSPVLWIIYAGYYTTLHSLLGNTPGKMLKSLVVIKKDGKIPLPSEAFIRWLGYILSLVPVGLGLIAALKNKENLTWHDQLAGTSVQVFENN